MRSCDGGGPLWTRGRGVGLFHFANIGVGGENFEGLSIFVADEVPAANEFDFLAVAIFESDFTKPIAVADEFLRGVLESCDVAVEQAGEILTESLIGGPTEKAFGAGVPIDDPVVHVADNDGVASKVEEIGLFADALFGGVFD